MGQSYVPTLRVNCTALFLSKNFTVGEAFIGEKRSTILSRPKVLLQKRGTTIRCLAEVRHQFFYLFTFLTVFGHDNCTQLLFSSIF